MPIYSSPCSFWIFYIFELCTVTQGKYQTLSWKTLPEFHRPLWIKTTKATTHHSHCRSKDHELHTATPTSVGFEFKIQLGTRCGGVQTHLPVEASSHGDDISCLAVNGEHVLRWALGGLSHDSVSHHPVRRGAVISVIRSHCHHVGTLEQEKTKCQDYLVAQQIAVP